MDSFGDGGFATQKSTLKNAKTGKNRVTFLPLLEDSLRTDQGAFVSKSDLGLGNNPELYALSTWRTSNAPDPSQAVGVRGHHSTFSALVWALSETDRRPAVRSRSSTHHSPLGSLRPD
jgi:hypothetical protein